MIDIEDPAQRVAAVVREAVTCEREECSPEHHERFVAENMQLAAKQINNA